MIQAARTVLLLVVATVQQHAATLAEAHRNKMDVLTVVARARVLALAVVKAVRRNPGVRDVHPHVLTHAKMSVQEIVKDNVLLDAQAVVDRTVQVAVMKNVQMLVVKGAQTTVGLSVQQHAKTIANMIVLDPVLMIVHTIVLELVLMIAHTSVTVSVPIIVQEDVIFLVQLVVKDFVD